jgi:Zn-dependent peptidase ImmA (M78 family)
MGMGNLFVRRNLINEQAKNILMDMGIFEPPVNVKNLLSQHFKIMYSEDIEDGLIYNRPGFKKPVIFINPSKSEARTNWTCAHELGHHALGHLVSFDIDSLDDWEHAIIEREAHIFAAELLMPYDWLNHYWNLYPQWRKVANITKIFGVSREALMYRLINTNLINEEELKKYFPHYYFRARRVLPNNQIYSLDEGFYEEPSIDLSRTN